MVLELKRSDHSSNWQQIRRKRLDVGESYAPISPLPENGAFLAAFVGFIDEAFDREPIEDARPGRRGQPSLVIKSAAFDCPVRGIESPIDVYSHEKQKDGDTRDDEDSPHASI